MVDKFRSFVAEAKASNTDKADVNEILYGYYMVGGKWSLFHDANTVKKQLQQKKKKLTDEEYEGEDGRAQRMAKETMVWAKKNGYKGRVTRAWWTARPGVLSKAVGVEVDSRKNPTDTLVQFSDGKFLGLSAKSTKGKEDIGFKNPGVGSVEKSLGIKLSDIREKAVEEAIKKFDLPKAATKRKKAIRADKSVQEQTRAMGSKVMEQMRDRLYTKLTKMKDANLKDYLLSDWMDATSGVYPPYIKVTGTKNGAKVEDPLKNSKLANLERGKVKVTKSGTTAIGIEANGKRIMKIRFKWESEPLATSMKLSGDPWK